MLTKATSGRYISILSDGMFHETVPQGTEGAELRKYKLKDGTTGEKWEIKYAKIDARITNVSFRDGDYGEQILVTFSDDQYDVTLAQGVASPFGEDLLKKLPNVDFSEKLTVIPYAFEDDKGKQKRGITIYQGSKKLFNYFYDPVKNTPRNGYPGPEGDTETYNSDDWKMYYMKARKFLVGYAKENIVPKFADKQEKETIDYPEEEINPADVPF